MTRRSRRLLGGAVATPAVALAVAVTIVTAWFAGYSIPGVSAATWMSVTKTGTATYTPQRVEPVFFLVIGNDERAGVSGARGDALHLVGVNPTTYQATILNFPRDTALAIPGHGTDKVNAANAYGGPRLTADTIGAAVGVNIPYTVQTNFEGFISLIDEMGGVDVAVPTRMSDKDSGSDFEAGPQRLSGERALAFSRDRKTFPTGDIARSTNQAILMIGALGQIQRETTTAASQFRAIATAARHTHIEGISLRELYDLYQLAMRIDPTQVRNVTVPLGSGGGSNLRLTAAAGPLFEDFRDDAVLQTN